DEAAAHRPGAAVEVFVIAPDGEIDLPVVQPQYHVARRVGQVEADHAALAPGGGGDPLHVEDLAGEEIDTAEQHQGNLGAPGLQQRLDVFAPDQVFPHARLEGQQRVGRVETVIPDLRLDGVEVRGEGRLI